MRYGLLAVGAVLAWVSAAPAPPVPKAAKFTFVSIQEKANQAFDEPFGRGYAGNDLRNFPQGEQKFEAIPFEIGKKVMQLNSKIVPKFPEKFEGIAVDRKCDKLHLLQATCFGGGDIQANSPMHCKDGTDIGEYVVNYDDKTSVKIPVVYGKDVRDWTFVMDEKEPERAKVVWKGENEMTRAQGTKLRIYLSTWANPQPDKKISSIHFCGAGAKTPCAPFCLGITAETK